MIGTTLDKYEVLQKVGEGGMATVYLGRHSTLNRDVAIKVLHPHLSSSTRNRKRFAREARAIEHLQHVNILEIFDYSGVDALDCYIITEFVDGQTLSDILRERGKVPSEVAAIMGLHLARALAYAHREGILHRDLKPDNVMVRFDGTLKLMDFGIARFLDESQVTMTGALVGSPAFMSPEQAREQPLDARSDLFSLGTMLFYLVTGHLPFSGSNPSLILKNVIESNRPSVSELSPTMSAGLADLIERLLSTDPEDRHNDAEDVSLALEACLAEANVDCEDSRWNLRRYIEDPDDFDQRLDDHLRQILIVRGKQHLDSGDHLAALRLFNRLLSMDEDNEEVLELVQGLHGEPHRSTRRGTLLALLLILPVIVGGLWGAQQRTPPPPLPQPTTTPTPTTRPVVPLPTSAPLPVPTPQPVVEPVPAPRLSTTVTAPRPIPQAEPPKPEVEPIPQEPGRVRFGDGPLIGTLYIDGTRMGSTREVSRAELELPVGEHVVEVRGDGILDWEQTIIVGSGETMTVPIQLVPRPATLHFRPEHYPGHCQVYLDDNLQGTLVELGYDLLIKRRTESCSVRVSCQGGPEHEKRYNYITDEDYFPPPT